MKTTLLVGISLFAAAQMAAAQQESAQLRQEIQKFYTAYCKSAAKNDWKALAAALDSNFVGVTKDGKTMNKAQTLEQMKAMTPYFRNTKFSAQVHKVEGFGNEAAAWITFNISGEQKAGENSWQPIKMSIKFVETFKRTANGWVITMSQESPNDTFGGK